MKRSVSLIVLRYLRLSYALYGTFCACPNLKDSSIYERFSNHMYKTQGSVPSTFMRYLRLPTALQGTLFWKKMIFHEIFQVGACPNLKDSFLYEFFFYSFVQDIESSVSSTIFLYLRLSNALYGTIL